MVGFKSSAAVAAATALYVCGVSAQTFQRLGGCPTLGCVFPPDQADFLAGQYFDIRLEVHAPVNGSQAAHGGNPDTAFTFTIAREGQAAQNATQYFNVAEPRLERWNFTWTEDLFARDARRPSVVNVAAKAYRRIALYEPGVYTATLSYYGNETTVATWNVRDLKQVRKTKNVIMFIGDGMTTNMITAARLIGHRQVNGVYQTRLQLDQFPVLGHQMTHSLDTFITDSANSASALYTGHKSSVNALGVYVDSSPNVFDDPKVETIAEIFHRVAGGHVGIVSTAFIADATPAGLTAHTRARSEYPAIVDFFLNGIQNYTWTNWTGPDVLFGGGAEQFYVGPGARTYQGRNYYNEFANKGYNVVLNNTSLATTSNNTKTLGIFSISNMAKWLDRNVYTENLRGHRDAPDGQGGDAVDQPGLKEMTLKAIDILANRSRSDGNKGFFLMSEAASIDKMMHVLDYDRALGELLELDDTVKATFDKLKALKMDRETLVLVTADHGHGFDVMGNVDTDYLNAQNTSRTKRNAIGTYQNSGLSNYVVNLNDSSMGFTYTNYTPGFPANWDPRYTLYSGVAAFPDHREDYQVNTDGPRVPAVNITPAADYYVNYIDAPTGFIINGSLPVSNDQGVHSLTDVPVFAQGPCQEYFGGIYNNIDIFFGIAQCLGLQRTRAPAH